MAKSKGRRRPTNQPTDSKSARPSIWDAPGAAAPRWQVVLILIVFALGYGALEIFSLTKHSATWDEPGHLLAGYAALARSDYRVDIEHPPLARMWAALPLLASPVKAGVLDEVTRAAPNAVAFNGPFDFGHRFLYVDNDADALLYRARMMIVLLGIVLGGYVFVWAHELLGRRAALIALALIATEPNLAAHATLVTTDFGVACFIFAALYHLWRATRTASPWHLGAAAVLTGAAVLTKFSGLILFPIAVVLLVILWRRGRMTMATFVAGAVVAAAIGAWALYGFRYAPSTVPAWLFSIHDNPSAIAAAPVTTSLVRLADTYHVLPNALTEGYLHGQGLATGRKAFLLGDYSVTGWWYYFPIAFALKTPLTLLVLLGFGVRLLRPRRVLHGEAEAFLILPVLIYFGVAITTSLNIGLRHLLPIYPFVIVLAAAGGEFLIRKWPGRRQIVLGAIVVLSTSEFATAYPHTLAFFNLAAGGPHAGYRALADSNVDWGQDLKGLARWQADGRIGLINLAYFGVAEPSYYGMTVRYIWGTTIPGVTPAMMGAPVLPGYVAVSATLLDGVPFDDATRDFYKPLRDSTPVADIGGSIKVYWVERPWWPQGR